MENLNNLCGCRPQKLANRSIEENLKECSTPCGLLNSCPYPKSVTFSMIKSAVNEESSENLQNIARHSMTFGDFHERTMQKQDRLSRPLQDNGKNIKQLAHESLYFGEFHEKASKVDGDNDEQ